MPGMGTDKSDEDGMVMCVEVMGLGDGVGAGFEVESVDVEVAGGVAGQGDVSIVPVQAEREDDTLPLSLKAGDQHNFLYAISFATAANTLADAPPESTILPPLAAGGSAPIHVATSPSQRFAARFGAEPDRQHERVQLELPKLPPPDQTGLRSVAIVVRGRPVCRSRSARRGDSVPGSVSLTGVGAGEEGVTWPTTTFASRWNCTLDVSPFTSKPAAQATAFTAAEQAPASALSLSVGRRPGRALGGISRAVSGTALRPAPVDNVESTAGSHRHTMASLASLAHKSPHVGPSPRPEQLDIPSANSVSRPTYLDLQTPGATGPSRRFFSLPPTPAVPPSVAGGELVGTPAAYGPGGFDWKTTPVGTPGTVPNTPAYPPHRPGSEQDRREVATAEEAGLRRGGAWDAPAWEEGEDAQPDTV